MKEKLLAFTLAVASMATVSDSMAETNYFGYCAPVVESGIGIGQKCYYGAAIELPGDVLKAYKGNKITGISVGFGSGVNKQCNVFVTKELGTEAMSTGSTTDELRLTQSEFTLIPLAEPVEIDGTTLYAGYDYMARSEKDYPLGYDGCTNSYTPLADYITYVMTEDELWSKVYRAGKDFGNLCIRVEISGDNMPDYFAYPSEAILPSIIWPGTNFSFQLGFNNFGMEEITSIECTYRLGDGEWTTTTVNMPEAVGAGAIGVAVIPTKGAADSTEEKFLEAYISKVNGKENIGASLKVSTPYVATSEWYERRMVLEEYTGLACGFCPRGWYGIEEFSKEVTDGSFIAIAVHNYGSDPMSCSAYNSWVNKYVTGAPSGSVNRMEDFSGFNPGYADIKAAYETVHVMCPYDLQIEADYAKITDPDSGEVTGISEDKVTAVAKMKFAFDKETGDFDYGLAFVVTQDDLGPYNQVNYYSGNQLGEMGGFEDLPSPTPLMYNDVARDIYNWSGNSQAVPKSIVKGEEYTYSRDVSLARCKSLKNAQLDKVNIIALLIDRVTGEILNGAKCRIGGHSVSGVADVPATEEFTVKVIGSEIVVDGVYESVDLYTVDGAHAGHSLAGERIVATPGLYIVSVKTSAGAKAVKVIVK